MEGTRYAYSATKWAAPAHVAARCLTCPPLRGPEPKEARKTCALRGYAKTEASYGDVQWERTPATVPRRRKQCMAAQWNPASSEEKMDCGTEKSAQGCTGDAERGKAISLELGRKAGRWVPEAIRKLCATCHVEKERTHFSGTQRDKRATAKKKCKDCLTTTGAGATAMRDCRGRQSRVAREFFSKTQWTE